MGQKTKKGVSKKWKSVKGGVCTVSRLIILKLEKTGSMMQKLFENQINGLWNLSGSSLRMTILLDAYLRWHIYGIGLVRVINGGSIVSCT